MSPRSTTPFLGQGMDCAFDKGLAFYEAVQESPNSFPSALEKYQSISKPNADAIEDLFQKHFSCLSEFAIEEESVRYKEIEVALAREHPDFVPLYELIEFTSFPYARCQEVGTRQRALIDRLVSMDTSGELRESQEGNELLETALPELRRLTS